MLDTKNEQKWPLTTQKLLRWQEVSSQGSFHCGESPLTIRYEDRWLSHASWLCSILYMVDWLPEGSFFAAGRRGRCVTETGGCPAHPDCARIWRLHFAPGGEHFLRRVVADNSLRTPVVVPRILIVLGSIGCFRSRKGALLIFRRSRHHNCQLSTFNCQLLKSTVPRPYFRGHSSRRFSG